MVIGTQYKTQIKPIYKTYDIQNYDILDVDFTNKIVN